MHDLRKVLLEFIPAAKYAEIFHFMPIYVEICHFIPGANPTIVSYNTSVVNFYNATGSLARIENKNIIFYF
jgi:hypothetical protein